MQAFDCHAFTHCAQPWDLEALRLPLQATLGIHKCGASSQTLHSMLSQAWSA